VQDPRWIGAANYLRIATADIKFVDSLKVTFLYVALAVPLKLAFALAVAMALKTGLLGSRIGSADQRHVRIAVFVADAVLGRRAWSRTSSATDGIATGRAGSQIPDYAICTSLSAHRDRQREGELERHGEGNIEERHLQRIDELDVGGGDAQ